MEAIEFDELPASLGGLDESLHLRHRDVVVEIDLEAVFSLAGADGDGVRMLVTDLRHAVFEVAQDFRFHSRRDQSYRSRTRKLPNPGSNAMKLFVLRLFGQSFCFEFLWTIFVDALQL